MVEIVRLILDYLLAFALIVIALVLLFVSVNRYNRSLYMESNENVKSVQDTVQVRNYHIVK